ncbi:hypothetical protein Pth03_04040 [Planotetraspora thailandica]|uniref:Uncharacterized protein n=1 Tax=Planotetraspora thailandica TaxID=487172 RepID=A0A8J3UWJ9_9ACTN|nr:hypothetical protein Pth03_04040 [Planotetraspora thailandica]
MRRGPQICELSRRRDPRILERGRVFVAHESARSRHEDGHGNDHHSVEPAVEAGQDRRRPLEPLCTHRFPLGAGHDASRAAGDRTDPAATHVDIPSNGEAP